MNEQAKFFWENRPAEATQALHDVMAERHRQMMVEGWTAKHDDEHGDGAMAIAAACYALVDHRAVQVATVSIRKLWEWTGWSSQWFKPKDKRRNLIRATALLLAEIERMDRAAHVSGVRVLDEAQPVAWVPIHPRNGPLWSMTTDKPDPERLPASYPLRPLTFADGVAIPATYRLLATGEVIERGDELLDDDTVTWHPVDGWAVGTQWDGSAYVPVRRRTDGVSGTGHQTCCASGTDAGKEPL